MDTQRREPLRLTGYRPQSMVGSPEVDGEVSVQFKLNRLLNEYESLVNVSLNVTSDGVRIDGEHGLRYVHVSAVQADDLADQVSMLNERLRFIEDTAATNEARAVKTQARARNVLSEVDFDV